MISSSLGRARQICLMSLSLLFIVFFAGTVSSAPMANRKLDLSAIPEEKIEEIYKNLPALQTNHFAQSDLDGLIRYLVTQEQYETVEVFKRIENGQEIYFLNLGKTQRLFKISFTGAQFFSESELRRETGLVEKSPLEEQSLADAIERLRRLYRDKGFRSTLIEMSKKKLTEADTEVVFLVSEGPQLKIRSATLSSPSQDFNSQFRFKLNNDLKEKPYSEALINEIKKEFRELFSRRGYYKAELAGPQFETSLDGTKADLTFTVTNPDSFYVDLVGATQFTQSTLRGVLDLQNYFSTNTNLGPELATKIKNHYLKMGYARVYVNGEEINNGKPFEKTVRIEISEGPRIRIDELKVTGTITESETFYRQFIKNHSSELITKNYYNREDLQVGLNNLVIDRQNQGFLRAKVLSSKVVFKGENKEFAQIQINFDEGPLTTLSEIVIQGNESVPAVQISEVLNLSINQPLRLNKLEESLVRLKNFYQSEGFLEMSILNEKNTIRSNESSPRSETSQSLDLVQYNADNTEAKLLLKVYEGPKVEVASILIEGNNLTRDSVIYKELDFKVGETLTPEKIEESVRRLQRVGHFNSVEIKTLEEKTQIAARTVVVKVTDRDPGLFTIGAGVNSENSLTFRGYTGIAYRNLLGTGRGASARLEGNYNPTDLKYLEYKVTLGYLEPYLFNTRAKGRVTYTIDEYVSDFKNRFATNVKQITWSLEQDLTSHILLSYDVWSSAQVRKFPIDNVNKEEALLIASTGPTLTIDYRDHPFNTTRGTLTRLGIEYASPQLDSSDTIHFTKSFATFTHYYPVRRGWVWANSFRGGHLKNLCDVGENSGCGVPYSLKGITLGGQSTIRGFLPDEAFPNQYDLRDGTGKELTISEFTMTTEATSFLFKSEIRFPISGAIGGALFYDGGAVWIKDQSFDDPYRDAVGVGIRYATPIGSVSFDIGYKLDRKEDRREETFPVYLSIGTF
jgi:outer membrane protein insertion porin family